MIPYSKQSISKEDVSSVNKVMRSNLLTQGKHLNIFENQIAKFVGSRFSVAVSSASAGLHLSCLALNVSKKDTVWTVPNTFIASASCALHCGAKVDFVDIDENTLNICVKKLEKKLLITPKKKRPSVIIPVHFAGQPNEQEKLFSLSKKYGFKIIEDASHSLGAKRKNQKVGNCKWSELTVFSFHPVKPITTAEGGVITTNNKKLYDKLRILRNHGISRDYKKLRYKSFWYYEQIALGFNYRMNEIQAALGSSQLKRIKKFNIFRNKVAKNYFKSLKNLPIKLPTIQKDNYSTFHLFVINFDEKKIKKSYDQIYRELIKNKIGVNLHYLPVHLQPVFKKFKFKKGDFPESEKHARTGFSLPIFYKISRKEQKKVIRALNKVFSKK